MGVDVGVVMVSGQFVRVSGFKGGRTPPPQFSVDAWDAELRHVGTVRGVGP